MNTDRSDYSYRPILHLTLWRCERCGDLWQEDDLQQVQPDGHYACPNASCFAMEPEPSLTEVECIARLVSDASGVESDEARLLARACLFTAGGDFGGTDTESFEDHERQWFVSLGRDLNERADAVDSTSQGRSSDG